MTETSNYVELHKLDGKTAAVTGGLGLIGRQICHALAQAGATVLVLDIDNAAGVKFEQEHKAFRYVEFDMADLKGIRGSIDKLFKDHEHIDIWVNSAYPRTSDWGNKLEDISVESWRKNVDMQMNSYCIASKDVAHFMKENRIKGSIINIASIYGLVAPDFGVYKGTSMTMPAAYSAIKAGIINFSRYLAAYYGKEGIRVNSIAAGGIFDNQDKNFVSEYAKRTSLNRMGTPQDIAGTVLFLASEMSSYITGQYIAVDGGWTSR